MSKETVIENTSIVVNHKQLEFLIHDAFKHKHPLFCQGTIGIGKSWTFKKVAKDLAKANKREFIEWEYTSKEEKDAIINAPEKYFVLIDKRLSEFDPTDIKGLPFSDGDIVDWKGDLWLKFITLKGAMGIVFFDELNLGSPTTQKSFYKVINDRQVSEKKMADDILVVGAGNLDDDRCNIFEMPKALDNRFTHCTLKIPSIDEWVDWAFSNKVDSRLISFLQQRPELLFTFDPNKRDKAFATPRSIGKYCSEKIKTVDDNNTDELLLLISTSVGEGFAMEFIGWLKHRKNVNLKKIFENPEKIKELNSIDLKYAFISLVSEWYREHYTVKDLEKVIEICKYLDEEFKVLTIKYIKMIDSNEHELDYIEFLNKIKECKGFKELIKDINQLLDEVLDDNKSSE